VDAYDLPQEANERVAQKVAQYYIPPIAMVIDNLDVHRAASVTGDEEVANIGGIDPYFKAYDELNCAERMYRFLSITIHGRSGRKPSEWDYVPPESSVAKLTKIVCSLAPPPAVPKADQKATTAPWVSDKVKDIFWRQ
jgi:hypothetical protein